jgi:hypothetical protein
MTWVYASTSISGIATSSGGALSFVDQVLDAIVAASAGWSKNNAAATYSGSPAWGSVIHTGGAQLTLAIKAASTNTTTIAAGQAYAGSAISGSTGAAQRAFIAYSPPGATLPTGPAETSTRPGSFRFSLIGPNSTWWESAWRLHVLAEDATGALLIWLQTPASSDTITAFFVAGPVLDSLNPADTAASAHIQWANSALAAIITTVVGEGQCLDGAGTRQTGFGPSVNTGLVGTAGTAIYLQDLWFVGGTEIAGGSVIKGRFVPAIMRGGRITSLRATVDTQTLIHLGGRHWVLWSPSFGAMPS